MHHQPRATTASALACSLVVAVSTFGALNGVILSGPRAYLAMARGRLLVSNDSGPMHMTCLVDAPVVGLFFADTPTLFAPLGTRVRCVAPPLYSIPLFSVYNGKDVAVGKPSSEVGNAAACAVSLDTVMTQVRELLAQRPVLRSSDAGRP